MKIKYTAVLIILMIGMLFKTKPVLAQERKWEDIDSSGYFRKQVIKREGYTLIFISKDSLLKEETKGNMIGAFFKVYPQEVKRFNSKSPHEVIFDVSKEYKGVAATLNHVIKFDQDYLRKNPDDIDVVTHELMHVVQDYHFANAPGWLVEGIADYGRYRYGVNNEKANWKLPDYKQGQNYTDAYKISARFLVWLDLHKKSGIVEKLDRSLRDGRYDDAIWKSLTGEVLDELWNDYVTQPGL
jgi:hypothetical protein